jgi:hypothetical protein
MWGGQIWPPHMAGKLCELRSLVIDLADDSQVEAAG